MYYGASGRRKSKFRKPFAVPNTQKTVTENTAPTTASNLEGVRAPSKGENSTQD